MNHKTLVRTILYCLTAFMLLVNVSGVAASPLENLNQTRKVFTVSPTGVDDTANILQAFADAQTTGPGATVQFAAGTFITDLIHVVSFNGKVKGMGQDQTIITPRADLSCQAAIDQGFLPSLFRFSEGSIQVSDLTLNIPNPDPCPSYTFSWWGGEYTTWLYFGFDFAGPAPVNMTECAFYKLGKVDATVDRVSFIIGEGVDVVAAIEGGGDFVTQDSCSGYGYNVETSLKVTRSYFESSSWFGLSVANIDGGSVVLNGNKFHVGGESIYIADIANAPVLVSDNILENPAWNGIELNQGVYAEIQVPAAPAQFIVRNNTIKIKDDYVWGVFINDNTGYLGENEIPRMKVLVEENQIIQNGATTVGIVGRGVRNALVLNNRFTGQGESAIVNGLTSNYGDFPSVGWLINGNDVKSLNPFPPETIMNKIVLGELSRNCRVVTDNKDNVLDLGTGNVIIGGHRGSGKAPTFHQPKITLRH